MCHSRIVTILIWTIFASAADAQSAVRSTEPSRLTATIDLTIGEANESRDAYIFGAIDGLAMDAQGRILVADRKDHTIRIFAATGRHLYTIGRVGKGPGDLDSPCCLTIAKDGVLWVKENGNRRYSAFRLGATEASYVRSIRGNPNSVYSADRVDFNSDGRLIDLGASPFGTVRHSIDSAGTVVQRDTVPNPPADSVSTFTLEIRGGVTTLHQPYGATGLRAYGANGEMARAVSSNYAVSWVAADGRRKMLVRRPAVQGPALSARERASTDDLLNTTARNYGVPRSGLSLTIPNRKTALKALGFDLDGRLWVERSVADGQPGEADVYDRNGKWIAIMQWPADVSMRFWTVRGNTGLAVGEDEDGVQRVVRLQFR